MILPGLDNLEAIEKFIHGIFYIPISGLKKSTTETILKKYLAIYKISSLFQL